jgi:hypothetical protein
MAKNKQLRDPITAEEPEAESDGFKKYSGFEQLDVQANEMAKADLEDGAASQPEGTNSPSSVGAGEYVGGHHYGDFADRDSWLKGDIARGLLNSVRIQVPFDVDAGAIAEKICCIADDLAIKMAKRGWLKEEPKPTATE